MLKKHPLRLLIVFHPLFNILLYFKLFSYFYGYQFFIFIFIYQISLKQKPPHPINKLYPKSKPKKSYQNLKPRMYTSFSIVQGTRNAEAEDVIEDNKDLDWLKVSGIWFAMCSALATLFEVELVCGMVLCCVGLKPICS